MNTQEQNLIDLIITERVAMLLRTFHKKDPNMTDKNKQKYLKRSISLIP